MSSFCTSGDRCMGPESRVNATGAENVATGNVLSQAFFARGSAELTAATAGPVEYGAKR
jgi:hypothetical protein